MANTEVNTVGAAIAEVNMISDAGVWVNPIEGEQALVTAAVSSPDGIFAVNLYHSNALVGNFDMMAMNDAGNNGDVTSGDGIYSALLPALTAGELIKFYIEAIENNTAKTAAYNPTGAEHDVYYATVAPSYASSTDVVINELLADNLLDATDESSEHEDWIELYNKGLAAVDLSGYHLSDNQLDLTKWEIPSGTILAPDDYLIIWADEDSAQGTLHANFKLSWNGETVTLLNAAGQIADEVAYGQQETDLGYARSPNGTGGFVIQQSTFGYNNNNISVEDASESIVWSMYPNPTQTELTLVLDASQSHSDVTICDLSGREVYREATAGRKYIFISTAEIADGAYVLRIHHPTGVEAARLIVRR
jgi:hypothetical protein